MDMLKIMEMGAAAASDRIGPLLDRLRETPFIQGVASANGIVTLTDRQRRRVRFLAETRSSYLDRAALNGLIANASVQQKATARPVLLMARYIPLPASDRLIEAGVNFVASDARSAPVA
jgi:hypothetical protein